MEKCITTVCEEILKLLLAKNKSYGNSVANPVKIFSRVNSIEQINIRIDDKLSRIARGSEFDGDDTELDLIGYLILKRAIKQYNENGLIPKKRSENKNDYSQCPYSKTAQCHLGEPCLSCDVFENYKTKKE